MFCSKCGAQLSDNAVFCTACGTVVESGQPAVGGGAPQPLPPKKSKKGLIIGIVAGVVAVAVIVVAVLFGTGTIGGTDKENKESTTLKTTEKSQEDDRKEYGHGYIRSVESGDFDDDKIDADEDKIVIDEFKAGTYGGVDFNSIEDVVNYYVEAYNYTKSLTAEYTTEDGSTATYYKLLGDEDLQVENILVDGSSNATINNLVPTLVSSLFSPSTYGLVPCSNRDPKRDNNNNDENNSSNKHYDFKKSYLTVDDVLMANVSESNGKIVLRIQPKAAEMSLRGDDSQGRFFEVLGDIGKTVDDITQLSWSEGTTEENCKVSYKGGVGTVVIDPATKEVTEADYTMKVKVDVSHADVFVLKNKYVSLDITYKNHYPASDEYLMNSKKIKRK